MTEVLHVQKVSGVSGSEAHLLSLLPLLRDRGWDARMLVLHQGEPGAREFVERMRADGVPTETRYMRFDLDPAVTLSLVRRRPDVLHTHLVHADVLGLPAGALAGVPARISTKHGFNEFRSNRLIAAGDRAAGRFAQRQIAISSGLARYLEDTQGYPPGTFTVVHYGIEPGPEPLLPPEAPRLAAVGRLIPIKGFDILFDAFARAREQVPALTLELAGEGPLAADLRHRAPEGVTLLGRVSPIDPVYQRNGIVVDGVTGSVVASGDVGALAAAIVTLASDPGLVRRFGAAARERAVSAFSADRSADGVERVYREALAR